MSHKIIQTTAAYDIYGAEKVIVRDCQALQKKGFKVIIVDISPFIASPFSRKVRKFGLPYYHIFSNCKFDFKAIFKLKDFLEREGCDLVHSNKYKADIISLIASRMIKVPVVTTVHGWCSENLKVCIYEKLQALSWRFFDKVTCISESYRQKALQYGVSGNKLKVIYNGIIVDDYVLRDPLNLRLNFLSKHKIPQNHFIIGIIGRLSLEKGHQYFIEAADELLKNEPKVSFLIIGEGPEEKNIKKLIHRLGINGDIRMLGYINDMKEIYAALDTVVISSLREGLPNVLLEAMVCGKPVIATNVGGIPEVIRNNTEGILILPKNGQAIAEALITLIRNPERRKSIASAARIRVIEHFTFERRIAQIEELYRKVFEEYKHN